jgi:hypothetical protein
MPKAMARVQNAIGGPKDTPRGKKARLLARCDVSPSRQAGSCFQIRADVHATITSVGTCSFGAR